MSVTKYLVVHGKVQNVMFRQTIMRGSISRGLIAGATNIRSDKTRVDITLHGDQAKIDEVIAKLRSGEKLNSWGAHCTSVEIVDAGKDPLSHEVNTQNVDNIKWKSGVAFYL